MPEHIVLDVDSHEAMLSWLCDQCGEDESLVYPVLLQCLNSEMDSEYELAYFLEEYQQCNPHAARLIPLLQQTAQMMLDQIKQMHLYEAWQLNYRFERILRGSVILVRAYDTVDYEPEDVPVCEPEIDPVIQTYPMPD